MYVVKYLYKGKKFAVRVLANNQADAMNTVISMTRGRIYSVSEVVI